MKTDSGGRLFSHRPIHQLMTYLIDHFTVVFLFITLVAFGYQMLAYSSKASEAFLRSFFTWSIGARGLIAFVANWVPLFADPIALSYGWPLRSSFQREIASAEGAFGVLGILCNWITGDFWTATGIAVSFCWFFSEVGGLVKMAQHKKDPSSQYNPSLHRGMRLDFISSILLMLCLLLWKMGV